MNQYLQILSFLYMCISLRKTNYGKSYSAPKFEFLVKYQIQHGWKLNNSKFMYNPTKYDIYEVTVFFCIIYLAQKTWDIVDNCRFELEQFIEGGFKKLWNTYLERSWNWQCSKKQSNQQWKNLLLFCIKNIETDFNQRALG